MADHDRDGAVVWAADGKDHTVLEAFYDELGDERLGKLQAISLDMGGAYKLATDTKAPHVAQCVDPFHVVKAANDAIDKTRRVAWNVEREAGGPARAIKHTRWSLVKDTGALSRHQWETLDALRRGRSVLYRCWQLKEALRDLYRLRYRSQAPRHLDWWLAWACRSRIPAFVTLSRTIRANRDRLLAAVALGLSNSKLEGLNSKIRLINHRGYGHHSAAALIGMIYLCVGAVTIELPLR